MYSEKTPALAEVVLLRMVALDFSREFISSETESLANGNIMVFIVPYVLQYILGTWYRPCAGTSTPNFECTPQLCPAPPHNDGADRQTQLLAQGALGLAFFLILNDLS